MKGITRRSGYWLVGAGAGLRTLSIFFTFVPNLPGQGRGGQQQEGPTPRTDDGHPDLSGRYLFVGGSPPQGSPVFRPETKAKYQDPVPSGACVMGGTPTTDSQCKPPSTAPSSWSSAQESYGFWLNPRRAFYGSPTRPGVFTFRRSGCLILPASRLVTGRAIRWSLTLSLIHTRMRNISVGLGGVANAWTHSEKEHVIQRFNRPSKNVLIYQVTVEDPIVLAKPFTSAPLRWSLAQGADDKWKPRVPRAGCDF